MGINPNIHKEVVDELEETRNVESVQESARFEDQKQTTKIKFQSSPQPHLKNAQSSKQPKKNQK